MQLGMCLEIDLSNRVGQGTPYFTLETQSTSRGNDNVFAYTHDAFFIAMAKYSTRAM